MALYFDSSILNVDPSWFLGGCAETFKDQYRDAEEQLPLNHMIPKPRGRSVSVAAFVDASHAANKVTKKSHTGFIIFVKWAPSIWYSAR